MSILPFRRSYKDSIHRIREGGRDTETLWLDIPPGSVEEDETYGCALASNTDIKYLTVEFTPSATGWARVCRALSTQENLEVIRLYNTGSGSPTGTSTAVADQFVHAVRKNQNATRASFEGVCFSLDSLVSYLSECSVSKLSLLCCSVTTSRQPRSSEMVAAAAQDLDCQCLEICAMVETILIPIIQGLRTNVNLKHLKVDVSVLHCHDIASFQEIKQCLESTVSLTCFHLSGWRYVMDPSLELLAKGLINSKTVTDFRLKEVFPFVIEKRFHWFKTLLKEKPNLLSLCLAGDVCKELVSDVCQSLRLPDFPLRHLSCGPWRSNDGARDHRLMTDLWNAVKYSKLERLSMEGEFWSASPDVIRFLSDHIPSLGIAHLRLTIEHSTGPPIAFKDELLRIFKSNYSLQSVELMSGQEESLLNRRETRVLDSYLARNKQLVNFSKDPDSLPMPVWSAALSATMHLGHSNLYGSLQQILQKTSWLSRLSKRKRKRPQYFSV